MREKPVPQAALLLLLCRLAPLAPAALAGSAGLLAPDWVRPGACLTYDLLTGSVGGSLNGIELNENGDLYTDGRRYVTERGGNSSHGLVQAIVAGVDGQSAALSQSFYLIAGMDTIPMLNSHQDAVVTLDTGGDFWMHPRKQEQTIREHPWAGTQRPGSYMARATAWQSGGQSWAATAIISLGDTGKTFWVYDRATGRLLYLSRVARVPPTYRDPSKPLRDAPSYATFLRYVGARQLNQPWLGMAMPEWARQLRGLSYRGQSGIEFPGAAPSAQPLSQDLEVEQNGGSWMVLRSRGMARGQVMIAESKVVSGSGCLLPYLIPPAALAKLTAGQVIDRDAHTGYNVSVAAIDAQSVTLQLNNSRQVMQFVYSRSQGLLIRTLSRERSTSGTNMFILRQMELVGTR